jgi:DNA-binding beta-propeller fold protein YncE
MHVMQATSARPGRSNPHSMRIAASSGRSALAIVIAVGLGLGAVLIAGCTASAADVRPPTDQLFFPTGLAVAPDDSVLFAASSNSELRYDSGSVLVFDLGAIKDRVTKWVAADGTTPDAGPCSPDPDHPEALICDETPFVLPAAGVRIGNFATEISLQNIPVVDPTNIADRAKYRLFVPTRGDPSVAWIDYDLLNQQLSCSKSTDPFQQCDDDHRLDLTLEDLDNTHLNDEPFGVFADYDPSTHQGFAVISHQTNGAVTLIDAPKDGPVTITDVRYNIFNIDPLTGIRGSTGVAGRPGATPGEDVVYVSSRTDSKVQTFTVGRPVNNVAPYLLTSNFVELDQVGFDPQTGGSVDSRGLTFSADGDRMYLVTRTPPVVQLYDTSVGPTTGFPNNQLVGASDICRNASTVAVLDFDKLGLSLGEPINERAYLTCFDDGAVYVVDPNGTSSIDDIIPVGRGPFAVAISPGKRLVFVSNFLEDTISVIDVDPNSPRRNRVVLRIGTPKAPTV